MRQINAATAVVLSVLLIPGSIFAQEKPTGLFPKAAIGSVQKTCRQGECHVTRLDERLLQRASADAEFYKVVETSWRYAASNRAAGRAAGKTGGAKRENYVVCSLRQPSYIFFSDGEWIQHMLTPGNDDGYAGYNLGSYAAYFAACHGLVREDWDAAEARKLGYPASGGESTQYEFKKIEEGRGLP